MIADPMSQAIDESITGKEEDHNGVHFFHGYSMKMDDLGRNVPGTGIWQPTILIMSVNHAKQEIRRKVNETDKLRYATKWHKFLANSDEELATKVKYLEEQMASLRKLLGHEAPKKRGPKPKIPQAQSVTA